jgi:histidinol-phosphate phosphatase family protein
MTQETRRFWTVVIPTVGRASLGEVLADLAAQERRPDEVVVVDDRARPVADLDLRAYPEALVRRSGGRGPAAARNTGWRATTSDWIVFVDDDVRLPAGWSTLLAADLAAAETWDWPVGGVQGRIVVPLPVDRRPTDWERTTAGLAGARWATADMAYRRSALQAVCGFDERFPRAYREDADLALRVRQAGWRLVTGTRHIEHPVRGEDFWVSARVQRGNADDALMRRLHGPRWRMLADCPRGRFRWHVPTVLAGITTVAAAKAALSSPAARRVAAGAGAVWLGLTGDLVWRRVVPGPRTRDEVVRVGMTSVVVPWPAVWHRVRGWWRHRYSGDWPGPVRAVLFDRDGTLVHDVPYNGDPELVAPVNGAAEAVHRLTDAGIAVGVLSNQSGVGRGLITADQLDQVNRRVDELVGPFHTWQVCTHTPDDGCDCRKPAPGMVRAAAAALGVPERQIVVVGDIGADVRAADAAGARAVLVPNGATRAAEVRAAPVVVPDLNAAVDHILRET